MKRESSICYPLPTFGWHSISNSLRSILIMQTAVCKNNCIFCAKSKIGHGNRTMSIDSLKTIVSKINNFCGDVWLHGSGEAYVLKDLHERISLIRSAWPNCNICMISTFNINHGKKYIEDMFISGLNKLIISCYGYTDEDYIKLHGSDSYDQLCKNIEYIKILKLDCSRSIELRYLHPESAQVFSIVNADSKLKKFKSFCQKNGIMNFKPKKIMQWDTPRPVDGHADWELPSPCPVVWGGGRAAMLVILENLDVVPCCQFTEPEYVFGNLGSQSLNEIYNSNQYFFFYESWWKMRPDLLPICNNCHAYEYFVRPEELARMAHWQARELHGQKVVFWGAGEAYRAYKSFFVDCEPVAMLMDTPNATEQKEIDGIPIYHPDAFLPNLTEPLPLVIFAMQKASPKILKTLKEKYLFYKPSKLVICPANAEIEVPVEPFFQD